MERKHAWVSLLLLLAILFFAGQSAVIAAEKPIELKMASFLPPAHHEHYEAFVPFTKEVEAKTKGRVKITIYPGEALVKAKDLYDSALQGISETAYFIPSYTAGRFPLTTVMELPLGASSAKVGTEIIWQLFQKHLKTEYPGVKMLSLWAITPLQLFTKKPVKTLDDLKGLRIRIPGPLQAITFKELGAAPISMPATDAYDAIQRGMIDGVVADFSSLKGFRYHEVVDHATVLDLGNLPMGYAVNLKTWNSLPPDIQKIMEEVGGYQFALKNAAAFDKHAVIAVESSKGKVEVHKLSADQKNIWNAKYKTVSEKWVADMEAKGLPGRKVHDDAFSLLTKYSK